MSSARRRPLVIGKQAGGGRSLISSAIVSSLVPCSSHRSPIGVVAVVNRGG